MISCLVSFPACSQSVSISRYTVLAKACLSSVFWCREPRFIAADQNSFTEFSLGEEPCRMKDEDTEEQTEPMGLKEDKQHQFEKPHHFKNEDGNAVISQTEQNFTQKQAGKTGANGSFTCTGEKPYTCIQRGNGFFVKEELNVHMRIQQTDLMGLKEDMQHQFEKPHHFKNEDGIAVISQTEQNFTQKQAGAKGSFTCTQCGKSFNRTSNLKRHVRFHTGERPYTCTQCGKSFFVKQELTKHMRIHTGERPFTCTQCGKSFKTSSVLKKHQLSHSGVRSFSCDQCDKTFVFASYLKEHLKLHAGVKHHVCTFCGKRFTQPYSLQVHQSIHTGVRPYVCLHCGKTCLTSSDIKKHQRIHTGEKPYKCSHCGKSFADSSTLKTHERIHTGEKPYQCSSCGRDFSRSFTLIKHKIKHCPQLSKSHSEVNN